MVPSRPRSTNSNWSNDRCLVVPNFRCYGNACSMRPDLYRDLRQISFLCSSCFLLLLARPLSPIQAHTAYPVFSLACSKQAHFFWGRACLIISQQNSVLARQAQQGVVHRLKVRPFFGPRVAML